MTPCSPDKIHRRPPLNEGLRASSGTGEPYDDVAESWFKSEADLLEALGTPEGESASAALLADEWTFIDHAKSVAFVVEHEM